MAALVAIRRTLYRRGLLRRQRLPVPVVVVGNLIVGGAGKTPTVLAVARLLSSFGHRPGIVSRGYGGVADATLLVDIDTPPSLAGDEPLLLRLRSGLPVCVGRDRVAAARQLLARHPHTTVVISDDGLQHLALERDVQIVVFDERGAGNGWLLPAGPLREPLSTLAPDLPGVTTLVAYNAAAPSTRCPGSLLHRRLQAAVPLAAWRAGEPTAAAAASPLDALRGRPIRAIAGVARPQRFFTMLREAGVDIVEQPLPDHFDFATLPWPADTAELLMTEKDAIKLEPERLPGCQAWVVPLDLQLDAALADALRRLLPLPARPVPGPSPLDDRHGHSTA